MSRSLPSAGAPTRPSRNLLNPAVAVLLVVAAGILLGMQFAAPNKRVIAVIGGLVLFGIAWRLDMVAGIGLLVLALPFPRNMVFGSSNGALILLLLVIWLLRVAQRQSAPPRRTPLDAALGAFLVVWIVSFYNLVDAEQVAGAMQYTALLVSGLLTYYLIVSNVRTERDLERLHLMQAISLVTIMLFTLYELGHPGAVIVPGWIELEKSSKEFGRNARVGGPFFDYELLAEFSAISLLLIAFLFVRARSVTRRAAYGALFAATTVVLFATVTRGALVSLGISLIYLTWIMRRRIRLIPFTATVALVVGGFLAVNFFVANFTHSGNVLARLQGTQFTGFAPEDRLEVWTDSWNRWMLKPILGHGPYFATVIGTHVYIWPHNGYLLIANFVGAVGLGVFLWLLARLWLITRPIVDDLRDSSYARSYLVIAHTQLILFVVDQTKIDFLRNFTYTYQVWVFFAVWTSASMIARSSSAGAAVRAP